MSTTTTPHDHAPVIAPPPLIYLAGIALGWAIHRWVPAVRLTLPPARNVAIVLLAAGGLLAVWSLVEFIRHRTHPDPYHPTATIIATGPFRFSRNPIYVAFAAIQAGLGLATGNGWMLVTLVPVLLTVRYGVIAREEAYLKQKFGDEYLDYLSRVRRWL